MRARHVETEGFLKEVGGGLQQWAQVGPADIVDDDVESAEDVHRRVRQVCRRLWIAEVRGHDVGLAAGLRHPRGHLGQILFRARGDDHVGASFGECHRCRGADAPAGPGYHGDLVLDLEKVACHAGTVASLSR
ncbi:hypothetical protein GCM10010251_89830 [Streptomyces aurantiogriseus]|uniref:Uncharacterized protein n=1 Tax=Streptomyces aurantiogriseus TaxID=66870 RepID=A0A918FPV3_9ACTN|nr:hypothetical protein [Streptomyces aurantiogriseus]GGR59108.1 hypothetical protein GCM10010251_89830 [Streptomyces aurantiogriseus]